MGICNDPEKEEILETKNKIDIPPLTRGWEKFLQMKEQAD